jgi:peroxiredoxin Q/BCP
MAQLRQDYDRFVERGAIIVAIGPENRQKLADYWLKNELSFIGIPDPEHAIANSYNQEVRLAGGGRMPALLVIDRNGVVRYEHYGKSMRDIPWNADIIAVLDELNRQQPTSDTSRP